MSTYFQRLAQRTGLLPTDSRAQVAANTPWGRALGLQVVEQVREIGQASPTMRRTDMPAPEILTVSHAGEAARQTPEAIPVESVALPVPRPPSAIMAPEQTMAVNRDPNLRKQPELSHIATAGQPAVIQVLDDVPSAPTAQHHLPKPAALEASEVTWREVRPSDMLQRVSREVETAAPEVNETHSLATTTPRPTAKVVTHDRATAVPAIPSAEAVVKFSEGFRNPAPRAMPPEDRRAAASTAARPLQQESSTPSEVVVHIGNVHIEVRAATTTPPPAVPAVQPRDAVPAQAVHHALHRLYLRGW